MTPDAGIPPWLQQFLSAWAETGGTGLAKHRPPVFTELKPGANPARVRQYPMSLEAKKGITPHIRRLLDLGVLRPCQSAWNTPLLPVRKPDSNDYRPVQDLREVNKRVIDIHPTVPNPYTLWSSVPPSHTWYTVLDLKDAFFSLPLAPKSQDLFTFEWHDPDKGVNGQLTWTRLPQGLKNSPTIFDEDLHEDLVEFHSQNPHLALLQYVDDLLLAAEGRDTCLTGTKRLLQTLGDLGPWPQPERPRSVKKQHSTWAVSSRGAPTALNPATLLPDLDLEAPLHDCAEVLAQVHGTRSNLRDTPLPDAEITWFTDGSSFIQEGQRYAGAAVVSMEETIWAEPLPTGTSAQKAELIALTKALTLEKDKKIKHIYRQQIHFRYCTGPWGHIQRKGTAHSWGKDYQKQIRDPGLTKSFMAPQKAGYYPLTRSPKG
ncbi:uncharacterized protein LOC144242164 [Crocuta crocuta]